ncbi:hypothetical protein [Gloeothece citriformis]|uniref:hypothetical protein n=1 Tax=Gloeothece citriformis TaxID=2546356 RepID=UPI00059DE1E4|nr:hypothetical protein [Gloeothece citriformis]
MIKTEQTVDNILKKVQEQATEKYKIKKIVNNYMDSIEEVINIPKLMSHFDEVLQNNRGARIIEEIVLQSRIEFNVESEEQDILADEEAR